MLLTILMLLTNVRFLWRSTGPPPHRTIHSSSSQWAPMAKNSPLVELMGRTVMTKQILLLSSKDLLTPKLVLQLMPPTVFTLLHRPRTARLTFPTMVQLAGSPLHPPGGKPPRTALRTVLRAWTMWPPSHAPLPGPPKEIREPTLHLTTMPFVLEQEKNTLLPPTVVTVVLPLPGLMTLAVLPQILQAPDPT